MSNEPKQNEGNNDGTMPTKNQTTVDLSDDSMELAFFVNKEALRSKKKEAEKKQNSSEK